jgi:triosephosphate isomerase
MVMKTFIVNYKAYKEGIDNGIDIALASREIADQFNVDIIVAVPFTLCREAARITKAIAQGIDPVEPGAATGKVSWYELFKSGCKGSLINHAENRRPMGEIEKLVNICKLNYLESYVCVASLEEAKEVAKLNPTAVSYEPPELIGSAMREGGASVATANEEIVKDFVTIVHGNSDSLALVGAGIKEAADVKKSVELGSDGILVASVIMNRDFRRKIEELAGAL